MADSTRTKTPVRRSHIWRAALLVAILSLAGAVWSAPAQADGDPASDVLATQALFLPQDGGLTGRQQAELAALLSSAHQDGYPLRVAIVASPTDLGSITELWRQPENYARFLGPELSLVYRGTLLVVMPAGFGLFGPGLNSPAQRAAVAQLRSSTAGPGLGDATISAVQRLAAAAGHPLRVAPVSVRSASATTDYGAVIAFAVGLVAIASAWIASVRIRPLRAPAEPAG